jgi:hypothetical protein
MSMANEPAAPKHTGEPAFLWHQVLEARRVVASERLSPAGGSSSTARADLLSALEAYAVSLTDHRRPIPYALRDELRMRRLTR